MKYILIVEDNGIIAHDLKVTLEKYGYKVCAISNSGEDGIEKIEEYRPDIVLMDIVLKGVIDGIEAAEIIYDRFQTPLIFCSSSLDDDNIIRRIKHLNYNGFIRKPFEEEELFAALKNV